MNLEQNSNEMFERIEQLYSAFRNAIDFNSLTNSERLRIIQTFADASHSDVAVNSHSIAKYLEHNPNINLDSFPLPSDIPEALRYIIKLPESMSNIRRQLIGTLTCNTPNFIEAARIHKQLCKLEESTEYFVPNES